VEAIRDDDERHEVVGQPEGRERGRRGEQREAPRLVAPELVVGDQIRELVVDRRDLGAVGAGLLEVLPDLEPAEVEVPDLPSDVASAVGRSSIRGRAPRRRIQGSEGQKTRMRQYARQIDQALRPLLNGLDLPLILAAVEPLDSIYRSVNSYPSLLDAGISGASSGSDAELAAAARLILDDLYAAELREIQELFALRASQRRASADVADVARAATYGLVDTVLVDIDEVVPGRIDEVTGALHRDDGADAAEYGVVDEIARRVWLNGGRVLAVRRPGRPDRSLGRGDPPLRAGLDDYVAARPSSTSAGSVRLSLGAVATRARASA
jgi:hypothetical protein